VAGSASAATSGTPRPGRPVSACPGTPAADWYAGSGNVRLTPPPVAPRPLPLPPQTVSLVGSTDSVVPAAAEHARAGRREVDVRAPVGLVVGAAVVTGRRGHRHPERAGVRERLVHRRTGLRVHWSSLWPQLMLIAVGVGSACAASLTASRKPASVLGAK
jgi:hypothetical protein